MPWLIKNQGLTLEKMGIPVTRSLQVQRLTLLTNIDFFKKIKTYGIAFVLNLHIFIFVFYLSFFYFYDAITEPYTGGVDLILHNF